MKKTTLLILIILMVFIACSGESPESGTTASGQFSEMAGVKDRYLAYEHSFVIDTKEEYLPIAYKNTIRACNDLGGAKCLLLNSSISNGEWPRAEIRVRVIPTEIDKLVEISSVDGKIVNESTRVEDLAKPLTESKKRLSMLEEHRDRLLNLQEKAEDDIDSLIKISSELAKVQSDIEYALGEKDYLLKRVEMDVVNIKFFVDSYRSFWSPVRSSLKDFSGDLSDGISGTITVVAYLFPGIILLCILLWIRKAFRKARTKTEA